jgi:cyclic pyranopterin phosphate synthase
VEIRFIEQMNTGSAKAHVAKTFMSGSDILNRIDRFTKITQLPRHSPHDPAERFFAMDLGVSFGLIASDTRPFCHNCNRLRLSADGRIRTCLYEPNGHEIGLVDLSLSDTQVLANLRHIISKKQSFHPALNQSGLDFSMAQVGG